MSDLEDAIRRIVREELRSVPAAANAPALDVLSTEQAADLAGVTAKTVRAWIASGDLPAGRRGRRRTVLRADLQAFMAGYREAVAGEQIGASLCRGR